MKSSVNELEIKMKLIDGVSELGFSTKSFVAAVQLLESKFRFDNKQAYDKLILELACEPIETKSLKESEVTFGYIVQETVRAHVSGGDTDTAIILPIVKEKVTGFLKKNPWVAEEKLMEVEQADGTTVTKTVVKGKRGNSKKEQALALWASIDQTLLRKDLIAIFVEKLGLTPGGASTYVHNCKNGVWK